MGTHEYLNIHRYLYTGYHEGMRRIRVSYLSNKVGTDIILSVSMETHSHPYLHIQIFGVEIE